MEALNPKVKKRETRKQMKLTCVTEGNYKCHLAIGLFAKDSVVFTTRRKDIRGCGRRGHLNCFSGGSALH